MFSGLTNQVSSWMGAVKGEHGAEGEPGAPTEEQEQQQNLSGIQEDPSQLITSETTKESPVADAEDEDKKQR